MNRIIKSTRKILKEMQDDHKREIAVYKIIKKYYDDFGSEQGDKLINAIKKDLSSRMGAKRDTDYTREMEPVLEMVMDDEYNVEAIGDSLFNSDLLENIIKSTDASEFYNENKYANHIIRKLASEYFGMPIYNNLIEYLKDTYFEYLTNMYSGEEYNDGYYLTP
jgi:hypothetical protein